MGQFLEGGRGQMNDRREGGKERGIERARMEGGREQERREGVRKEGGRERGRREGEKEE